MTGSQHALTNGEGMLIERLGLLVLALLHIEVGEIAKASCSIRMVGLLFKDGEGMLIERLGLLVLALLYVQAAEVAQGGGSLGMVGT